MPIQRGISKEIRVKAETVYGQAPTATGAQVLRRVQGGLSLGKASFGSQETRPDQQRADFRHGGRSASGQLTGELSPRTYELFFRNLLRANWSTAATTGALTNVTASSTAPHFTRATGSFITDGFKIGDIGRWTGWTTGAVGNNARNYRIVALTATQMTVADATTGAGATVAAKAAGDSVTFTVTGKKLMTPSSGLLDESFAIEEWFPAIPSSELFLGCKVGAAQLTFPPAGIPSVQFSLVGNGAVNFATSAYFTSPSAPTTTGVVASNTGAARFTGTGFTTDQATITNLTLTVNGDVTAEQVAFSNFTPGLFPGVLTVQGQVSVLFQDTSFRDAFLNEIEVGLFMNLLTGTEANADFLAFSLPRLKFANRGVNDQPKALTETIPFEALVNTQGGVGTTSDYTTLTVQDSQAP